MGHGSAWCCLAPYRPTPSTRKAAPSGMSQECVPGPVSLNIFIQTLESRTENISIKPVDYTSPVTGGGEVWGNLSAQDWNPK